MDLSQNRSFCSLCSLQFSSEHSYDLHSKLVHKDIFETRSIKKELKTSDTFVESEVKLLEKSKVDQQIALDPIEESGEKLFKCKICDFKAIK